MGQPRPNHSSYAFPAVQGFERGSRSCSSKPLSTREARCSHPTGAGSRTSPTIPVNTRCTCKGLQMGMANGRSRTVGVNIRRGRPNGRDLFFWSNGVLMRNCGGVWIYESWGTEKRAVIHNGVAKTATKDAASKGTLAVRRVDAGTDRSQHWPQRRRQPKRQAVPLGTIAAPRGDPTQHAVNPRPLLSKHSSLARNSQMRP